jgi:hypothetical protein
MLDLPLAFPPEVFPPSLAFAEALPHNHHRLPYVPYLDVWGCDVMFF